MTKNKTANANETKAQADADMSKNTNTGAEIMTENEITTQIENGAYAVHADDADVGRALECARGDYQRAVLTGHARLSGGDLRGKARRYGARYARSRANLLARMAKAGVVWSERQGPRGRRVLVIGAPRPVGEAAA